MMAARLSGGLDRLLLAAAALLLAAGLGWQNGLGRADAVLYDAAVNALRHRPSPDIVIVAIDDRSLAQLGRWPWNRERDADLIERIAAQGPRAIGLDLLLSEPDATDPQGDRALAAALRRSGAVVLPVFMASLSSRGYDAVPPIPPLAEAAGALGHVSVEMDPDGIVRSVFLREGARGRWYDHFAVALLRAAGHGDAVRTLPGRHEHGGAPAAPPADDGFWHRDNWAHIAFAGPPGTYRTVSAADVLSGKAAADAFRDKIVLVGPTAIGLGDVYPTPVSGQSIPMSGVEISASIADDLLAGRMRMRALPWQSAAFALAMVALLLPGLWLASPRRALALTAALMVATAAVGFLALHAGLWLPPGAPLAVMLLLYPLWVWRRLEAAVAYLGAELDRLHRHDPVLPRAAPAAGDLVDRRIEALRQAADQLRALHLFIASTLESLPDATLVAGDDGAVLLGNRAAARYFGLPPAELRGAALGRLLRGLRPLQAGAAAVGTPLERLDTGALGLECRDDRGGEFLYKRIASPGLPGRGRVWIVCLVDLHALRQAERKRDEALRFLSHDMRAPQTSIQTLLDLYEADSDSLPQHELLARIRAHAGRTLELAEAFVQAARVESMPFGTEPLDYSDIVLDAVDACWEQAEARRIRLRTALPPNGAWGEGNRTLLARALINVVSNAIKYSPPGSPVDCDVRPVQGGWCLAVRDRGRGIDEAGRARLFEPFARLGGEGDGEPPGIGLGLTFTKTVVERHGGRVEVDSRPGEGTEFRLCLPGSAQPEDGGA
ncbi:CHASE2 domain-containing protein [Pigmentiphaga soli]|uniref:histidine kinase n=1 Tax=Pigmentiphaga soli TaxID=1007095 RepID=A0ABP8H6X3_9BURK